MSPELMHPLLAVYRDADVASHIREVIAQLHAVVWLEDLRRVEMARIFVGRDDITDLISIYSFRICL